MSQLTLTTILAFIFHLFLPDQASNWNEDDESKIESGQKISFSSKFEETSRQSHLDLTSGFASNSFTVNAPTPSLYCDIFANELLVCNVANASVMPVYLNRVNANLAKNDVATLPLQLSLNSSNEYLATDSTIPEPSNLAEISRNRNSNIFRDISISAPPPPNDDICDAISMSCGSNKSGTTVNATSSNLGIPSCFSPGSQNDVFYKFLAISGNTYIISVTGGNYDGVLALYKGVCSGIMTEIACSEEVAYGTETIEFTPDADNLIYIRTYDPTLNGEFVISLDCILPNDDPCDALLLTCGNSVSGSTSGASTSTIGAPSCSFGPARDVFYKIDAIAGVNYSVSVLGINYNGVIAAYIGDCEGGLYEVDCAYSLLGVDHTVEFTVSIDQTVLIQTYRDVSFLGGNFTIEVACSNLPNDDPCDAIELVCGESYSGSSSGASNSIFGSAPCTQGSANDVFFKFNALANVEYSITLGGATYDGVIAAYPGLCSDSSAIPFICANNGGSSGVPETINIAVATDQEILIQIYDFNANGVSNYTITLHCPIPENDNCADAITLIVNEPGMCQDNGVPGTNYGATNSDLDSCSLNSPDVYYKFNSGDNEQVIIFIDKKYHQLAVSLHEETCSSPAIFCDYDIPYLIEVTPNTDYYIRIYSIGQSTTGNFTLCVERVSSALATINGSILGWNSNCSPRNVNVRLYNLVTGTLTDINTNLSSSGTFSVSSDSLYAGLYNILVKTEGALAVLSQHVLLNGGENYLITDPVILGNLNNNHVINLLDLSIFSASFGTTAGSAGYNFLADFNCDGVINIFDISILSAGFNKVDDTFMIF